MHLELGCLHWLNLFDGETIVTRVVEPHEHFPLSQTVRNVRRDKQAHTAIHTNNIVQCFSVNIVHVKSTYGSTHFIEHKYMTVESHKNLYTVGRSTTVYILHTMIVYSHNSKKIIDYTSVVITKRF